MMNSIRSTKMVSILLALALVVVTIPGCGTCTETRDDGMGMGEHDSMDMSSSMPSGDMGMGSDDMGMATTMSSGDMQDTHSMMSGGSNRTLYVPTGTRSTSSIMLVKSAPAEVIVGQPFEYTITATNLTNQTLEGVVVRDQVGGALSINNSDPTMNRDATGNAMWDMGDLGPGGTRTVRVNAVANQLGDHRFCAEVSYAQLNCITVRAVQPALQLTKRVVGGDGSGTFLDCDNISFVITVTNTGSGDARNVVVTDSLPDGLVSTDGRSSLTWDVGTLGAGQSREIQLDTRATRTGSFTNTAQATADGGLTATDSASVTVNKPQLSVSKSCRDRAYVGSRMRYEITVSNTGNIAARDVTVRDRCPSNASFVSATLGGTPQGDSVVWNLGTLNPGDSRTLEVVMRAGAIGTAQNTVEATAYCADPVTDSCSTEIEGIPAVLLEVIDVEDPIAVGETVEYVIRVTNQGSATDTNIRIVCQLPPEAEFVSAGGATRNQGSGRTVNFAPLAALSAKASTEWRVVVRAASQGNVRFKVTMNTDQTDPVPVEETEATNFYQ